MLSPVRYVEKYVDLWSWMVDGDWSYTSTPIIGYLQNGQKNNTRAGNAATALQTFTSKLVAATKNKNVMTTKMFTFEEYLYFPNSIRRTFMGKASPWEIQETLQLASEIGVTNPENSYRYCFNNIGVDCGGFVASYWGKAIPDKSDTAPAGWAGIAPRDFWNEDKQRRRRSAGAINPGDAAIFFSGLKDNNPDIKAQSDGKGGYVAGSGSKAFHIGVVNYIVTTGQKIDKLEIAESSGSPSQYGGDGVNVRHSKIIASGTMQGYVYVQANADEWIFFVKPPAGSSSAMPYRYGEE